MVFIRAKFCLHSLSISSTQQRLTPVEGTSLPTSLRNFIEISHKTQVIELGRQTYRQHFYITKPGKTPQICSFLGLQEDD